MAEKAAVLTHSTDSVITKANTTDSAVASDFVLPVLPPLLPPTHGRLQRQAKTHLLMGSSCGIWLSYLVLSEHVAQASAWVFLLGGLLLSSLSRWLSVRQELSFCLEPQFQPKYQAEIETESAPEIVSKLVLKSSSKQTTEEPELEELAAPIIALISIALPMVLLAAHLILHIDLTQLQKPVRQRQVVDIELVAPTDTIDRKDILPSTSQEIASKAHKGALYTVASPALMGAATPKAEPVKKATTDTKVATVTAESIAKNEVNSQAPQAEPQTSSTARPQTFKAPDSWKTIVISKEKDNSVAFSSYAKVAAQTASSTKSQAFLSEVEPANMIESIDSDGRSSPLTIQSGGRSNGGEGAPSNLHEYLKLLNKEVKSHWIPPRGVNRIAIIEFRISADGKLLSTKALSRTGDVNGNIDVEAESAAISAITKSFPLQPLPAEVKASYLDVRYTFNYRFNQIDEVSSRQ